MAKITKPDMSIQWAQTGTSVVPADAKKQQGWTQEKPPYEYMNWLQNRQDSGIAYTYQMGIPEWDSSTEYQYASGYASFVQKNGVVYKAIATGSNKDPVTQTTYWTRAFDDYGAAATVSSALSTHITNYGTLAGLTNASTARSNLSVYSKSECDNTFAAKYGNDSNTFSVGYASLNWHAIRKDQFDAKTGQATESAAGIAYVASYAVTIAGLSDTTIVTPAKLKHYFDNTGATTSAKGTVELATTAETITGTDTTLAITPSNITGLFADAGRKSHLTSGYQKLPGGLTLQWGYWSGVTVANNTNSVSFPVAFSTACLNVTGNIAGSTGVGSGYGPYINTNFSTTDFRFGVLNTAGNFFVGSTAIYWIAIGY